MAHFAKISESNEVLQVVYMDDKDTENQDGVEIESEGQYHLEKHNHWPQHLWIKCSYRTRDGKHYENDGVTESSDQSKALRKNYAEAGGTYDAARDAFIPPKPFASWVLNATTCIYEPPVTYPDDGKYYVWNEDTTSWDELT